MSVLLLHGSSTPPCGMPHCSSDVPAVGTALSHSQRERDQDDLLGMEEGRGTRAAPSPSSEGFTAQQQSVLSSISQISSLRCLSPLHYKRAGGQALDVFHVKEQLQELPAWKGLPMTEHCSLWGTSCGGTHSSSCSV